MIERPGTVGPAVLCGISTGRDDREVGQSQGWIDTIDAFHRLTGRAHVELNKTLTFRKMGESNNISLQYYIGMPFDSLHGYHFTR